MKKIIIIYVLLIVGVIALAVFRGGFNFLGGKTPTATVDGKTFNLILAKTDTEQTTGLSGRNSLDVNTGMLFIFPTKDT